MSLKVELNNLVNSQQITTLQKIYTVCDNGGYKYSNAERRLRELVHDGLVIEVYNPNHSAIIAYRPHESQWIKEMREIREKAMKKREVVVDTNTLF